jgi:ACR3 family arsenite efflux pump ArsB
VFEKYLTVWVGLCIVGGIVLGKIAPGLAQSLDAMSIYVNGAPVVSIPIAIALFFMRYPIMVEIDFAEVIRAGRSPLMLVKICLRTQSWFPHAADRDSVRSRGPLMNANER